MNTVLRSYVISDLNGDQIAVNILGELQKIKFKIKQNLKYQK